jgi:hypothetical protein
MHGLSARSLGPFVIGQVGVEVEEILTSTPMASNRKAPRVRIVVASIDQRRGRR